MSKKEKNINPAEYKPVSVGSWIGTLLLSAIPVLNVILWIIWAFSAKRPSRRSFAAALLIFTLIFVAAAAVVISLCGLEILEWARQINPALFSDLIAG